MIIEPAAAGDLDAIERIERHSFARPWSRAAFVAELARSHARLIVARDPAVVAFCNFWVVELADGGELHIHSIAVDPDRRRHGIAARLVDHAIEQARSARCTIATLEVRRGNTPAIALYQRAGFTTVTVRAGYYQDNGEDALVMTRSLAT